MEERIREEGMRKKRKRVEIERMILDKGERKM